MRENLDETKRSTPSTVIIRDKNKKVVEVQPEQSFMKHQENLVQKQEGL